MKKLNLPFMVIFMFLFIASALVEATGQPRQQESEAVTLKPIKTVYPVYPEHLKKEVLPGFSWVNR